MVFRRLATTVRKNLPASEIRDPVQQLPKLLAFPSELIESFVGSLHACVINCMFHLINYIARQINLFLLLPMALIAPLNA